MPKNTFFRRAGKSGKIFSVQKNSTRTNRVSNDIINYYISIRIQSEWVHSSIILASIIYKAQFFLLSGRVSFHLTSVRSHKIYFLINLTLYRWCDTLPDNKKWGLRLHISAVSFALSDNSLCLDDNFKVIWHKSNDVTFFLISEILGVWVSLPNLRFNRFICSQ